MRLGSVAVVGTKAEALNLAEALAASEGFGAVTVYGREAEAPPHTVFARGLARYVYGLEPFDPSTFAVILAVADGGIPETAVSIAGQGRAPDGCAAFHLSPTLPTDALAPLHGQGYALGCFQPFVSGPSGGVAQAGLDPESAGATTIAGAGMPGTPKPDARIAAATMAGAYVAVTGSPSAIGVARRLADALDAEVLEVPAGRRPLVDAASVLLSGALEPLMALSTRLMERAGIAAAEARPALVAAARSALAGLEAETPREPIHPAGRGDLERVALHLRALDGEDQRLYATLASEILRLEQREVDDATRAAIHELLDRYTDVRFSGTDAEEVPVSADLDSGAAGPGSSATLDPQTTTVG